MLNDDKQKQKSSSFSLPDWAGANIRAIFVLRKMGLAARHTCITQIDGRTFNLAFEIKDWLSRSILLGREAGTIDDALSATPTLVNGAGT